jgi:alkylated DNA nucleotide flippase Atl1
LSSAVRIGDVGANPDFRRAVIEVLERLAPGDVVTYGEVATEAGYPGRARAVGHFLATEGNGYAWWRVVTSSGRLVPGHETEHAARLAAEGVALRGGRVPHPSVVPSDVRRGTEHRRAPEREAPEREAQKRWK